MSVYTPNPAAGIASAYTMPDDGISARNAMSVRTSLEPLADGLASLKAKLDNRLFIRTLGHIQAPALHSWDNTSGAFVVAEQAPIKDLANVDTPFDTDIVANDVLEIDFDMVVEVDSSETANAFQWQFKLVYSETATDFVSGTWADPLGTFNLRTVQGVAAPSTPTVLIVSWSFKVAMAGTTGHCRFAIQANRVGLNENAVLASYSAGRYRWLRIGPS